MSPLSPEEKRETLDAVLNSKTFARSAQLRAFLEHICEMEIVGRAADISEYQIAVAVLSRPSTTSLIEDSTVRNRAYELRQRLDKYYSQENPQAPIRIEVPRGGYVPSFIRRDATERSSAASLPHLSEFLLNPGAKDRRGLGWTAVSALLLLALLGGILFGRLSQFSRPPAILREVWGPFAEPGADVLICISTNLHLIVRPRMRATESRTPASPELYPLFQATRPLAKGEVLYMQPSLLAVPLGEVV